jgi:type III secretory pathway component EscS
MCSMLLEPQLNAGAWAGTNQFNLAQLQLALQKRVQEVIQATSCNIAQLSPISATPGVRRNLLPDTTLEPRRMRFLAVMANTLGTAASGASQVTVASAAGVVVGQMVTGTGIQAGTFVTGVTGTVVSISLPTSAGLAGTALQFALPVTMTREDSESFQAFEPGYLQTYGWPQSWAVASEPPLAFDTDLAPNTPGNFDVLALISAPTFAPPAASLLGVPDDWSWLPMYGALADVLGIESEGTDRQRSAYCMERYTQGLELMKASNWLVDAHINEAVASLVSLAEMDANAPGWQESNAWLPQVVEAGMDMVAPTPGIGQQLTLNLVGNAPLLDSTGVYVQCARDDFEAILNYAHHIASFKMGGQDFITTMPMLKDFFRAAGARNSRWLTYGPFVNVIKSEGKLQDEAVPRGGERAD